MKIILACALFLLMKVADISGDVVTDDEIRNRMELRSETMWVYNSNGMTVYSVEGELLNSVQKDEKCTYGGDLCNFNAIVSDNRKYVFAVQEMDDDTGYVTVHNLDTEQVVGLIPTCAKPVAIKYHSARHEMWITCATTGDEKSDGDEKSEANYNVDVIGAESLTSNHQQVSISTLSSGKVTSSVVHNDLGNVMYTSQSDSNVLTKVDLSSKEILETFSLFEGDDQGLFGMTYCNANKHMYAYTSENDLVEFDTVADSLVSKTVIPDFEFNKIVVKPEGDKVFLLGTGSVQQVNPKKNGVKSVIKDLPKTIKDAIDVVFSGENAVFLTSSKTVYVFNSERLKRKSYSIANAGHSIEMAGDGNYVWVTTQGSEIQIFELSSKGELNSVKTLTIQGTNGNRIQSVCNKERLDELNALSSLIELRVEDMEDKIMAKGEKWIEEYE